jgi:PAS domain S-box-containing protein
MGRTVRKPVPALIDGAFRLLADSLPQLIWVADPDGGCDFVNRCWTEYTGLTVEEAAGSGWQAVVHPDDLATVGPGWAAAVAAGASGEMEERIRRHDGDYRWFLVRFEPYRDASGAITCWFGTSTDIDERKKSDEARRQYSEERYRRLVETAHDGIGEIDFNGRLVYVNDRMAAMLGHAPDEMIGRSVFDFSFEEDHAAAREHIGQRAQGIRRTFEWRWRHKDGSEVWALASAAPLLDAAGKPVGAVGVFSDLTGRRAAVERLRRSEERFRTSVESLLDSFAILTAVRDASGTLVDFRIEYVNDAACTDNRLPRESQVGQKLLELFPAHRGTRLFDTYRRVVDTGEPATLDAEYYEDDVGGPLVGGWYDIRITRLGDGLAVAWRDVTERRRLEMAFRELANTSPAILWETDATGSCTFMSARWTKFTGQPLEQSLDYGWTDVVHRDEREPLVGAFIAANAAEEPFELECRLKRPDGGYRWAITAGRPRFDPDGTYRGYSGSIFDIDDHKRAEVALRESEQRMRLAADVARVGTFEWNIQTNVNVWTPEMEAIYGLPAGSFAGTYEAWRELVHPDDLEEAERRVRQSVESGGFGGEWRIIRPDGSVRWIEARAWVYHDDVGTPLRMIGVNFDVTDRKLADEALHDASERKDAFLAVLAHELRNPLGPLRNAAGILARVGPENSAAYRQAAHIVGRQVSQMARLTDDLLDVSRIARGKVRLRTETLDLAEIVRQTTEDYRPTLEKDSDLTLSLSVPGEPVWVEGDAVRLTQSLGNLLHNASKFTGAGGRVDVELTATARNARVTVRDNGRGMSAEMQRRLFEPFSQADDSLDRSAGGLGLGLALVKGLVELHEGSVTAHSAGVGRGSVFTLTLPLVTAPADAETTPEAASDRPAGLRILVVEDNADAAVSIQMLLELDGHAVDVALDGASGVSAARRHRPDIVLCDIGLPGGMNGYEVARQLRASPGLEDVMLVAVTGYGQDEDRQKSAAAGFDRHLLKPIDFAELGMLLNDLAARRLELPASQM